MNRSFVVTLAAVAALGLSVRPAAAQGFDLTHMDIGPTVGLGSISGASAAFGGRFETAIKALPDLGDGILGIQVGATYYSWSTPGYSWSYIPIGATANYHFNLDEPKIDPFLGLGLGFQVISCDYSGSGVGACGSSALYFIGRAGIRYFMSDSLALYADAGAGGAAVNIGLMFGLR
jgi:hypothetical protein